MVCVVILFPTQVYFYSQAMILPGLSLGHPADVFLLALATNIQVCHQVKGVLLVFYFSSLSAWQPVF
jgi:hypothetical protein